MKRSKMARPIALFLAILLWLLSFPTSVAASDLSIETDTAPSLSTTLGGTQLNGPASRSYQGYITIKVYGPCGYLDQFQVYCDGTKIQSEWYTIPSLDFWLEGTPYENYDYGRVTGVTSVWYPDAKDKQVGQVVC